MNAVFIAALIGAVLGGGAAALMAGAFGGIGKVTAGGVLSFASMGAAITAVVFALATWLFVVLVRAVS